MPAGAGIMPPFRRHDLENIMVDKFWGLICWCVENFPWVIMAAAAAMLLMKRKKSLALMMQVAGAGGFFVLTVAWEVSHRVLVWMRERKKRSAWRATCLASCWWCRCWCSRAATAGKNSTNGAAKPRSCGRFRWAEFPPCGMQFAAAALNSLAWKRKAVKAAREGGGVRFE